MIKYNKLSRILFVFFFIGIIMGAVFATDVIPSTEPCWVMGTVTAGTGITTVEGLIVQPYNGSTLLTSGTSGVIDENGNYSLNSVGALTGNIISLKIYGASFDTFIFNGYCDVNGNPWIIEDFIVSKVANGESCSNSAICTSGNCSGGVCAALSGGGSSSSSSSSSSSTTSTTSTTEDTVVTGTDATNILSTINISTEFGANTSNDDLTITLQEKTISISSTGSNYLSSILSSLDETTANQLELDIQDKINKNNLTVTITVKSYTIKDTVSNKVIYRTKVEMTIVALDNISDVIFVQEIPKDVASNVLDIVFNVDPTLVLKDDPIVQWNFDTMSIGQSKDLSYFVKNKITIAPLIISVYGADTVESAVVIDDVTEEIVSIDETTPSEETITTPTSLTWLWIVIVIVILALIMYLIFSKKKDYLKRSRL